MDPLSGISFCRFIITFLTFFIITVLLLDNIKPSINSAVKYILYVITLLLMTRWAKDTKEFTVRLYKSKNRGAPHSLMCRVPRPLAEELGNPTSLLFKIQENGIMVTGVEDAA